MLRKPKGETGALNAELRGMALLARPVGSDAQAWSMQMRYFLSVQREVGACHAFSRHKTFYNEKTGPWLLSDLPGVPWPGSGKAIPVGTG